MGWAASTALCCRMLDRLMLRFRALDKAVAIVAIAQISVLLVAFRFDRCVSVWVTDDVDALGFDLRVRVERVPVVVLPSFVGPVGDAGEGVSTELDVGVRGVVYLEELVVGGALRGLTEEERLGV